MLLALTLLAQTADDPDASKLAMSCTRAIVVVGKAEHMSPLRAQAIVESYLLLAAEADPRGKPLIERFVEIGKMIKPASLPLDQAQALVTRCDARFPTARSESVTLPADPFRRDVLCYAMTLLLQRTAQSNTSWTGDAAEPLRWRRMNAIFSGRLTDGVMAAHGIRGEPAMKALGDEQVAVSLHVGNPYAISLACEAVAGG